LIDDFSFLEIKSFISEIKNEAAEKHKFRNDFFLFLK